MLSRLFLAIASLASLASATLSDCSKGLSLFTIKSMSFSPDPPTPGTNSTLLLSMNVPEEITDGTATYTTTLNFIPFQPTVDPLCETTIPCPIQVGQLDTVSSYPFPEGISGTMTLKIQWTDGTGRSLMCLQIKTSLASAGNTTESIDNGMCPIEEGYQVVVYQKPRGFLRGT